MAASGNQRKSNQQSQELPDSEDYIKNRKECHRQIEHFEKAPDRPKWMRHFRYLLSDKVMHIGVSYGTDAIPGKYTVVELNQGHATFVAELKKAIVYFQKLCYKYEKQAPATKKSIDHCDGNCTWCKLHNKHPKKEQTVSTDQRDQWDDFEKMLLTGQESTKIIKMSQHTHIDKTG